MMMEHGDGAAADKNEEQSPSFHHILDVMVHPPHGHFSLRVVKVRGRGVTLPQQQRHRHGVNSLLG